MSAQDFVPTTIEELHDRIDVAHQRFAAAVTSSDPNLAVGDWTAHDVCAHVINVVNRYTEFDPKRLAADPRGVDLINDNELSPLRAHSTDELVATLDTEMAAFRDKWGPHRAIPLDTPAPFHGGATIDYQSIMTNLLGEFLVHGLDVVHASGQPFAIDARDGALLIGFATQILPFYVKTNNIEHATFRLELDGVAPWTFDIRGPSATARTIDANDDEPDVIIAGSPVDAALLFYGRRTLAVPSDGSLGGELRVIGGKTVERAHLLAELTEVP